MDKVIKVQGRTRIQFDDIDASIVLGVVPSELAICSARLENGRLIVELLALPGRSLPKTVTVHLK